MLCRSTRGEFEKFRAISDERCTCHLSEAGIATAVPRTRLQESSMRSQTTFLDDYLFAIIHTSASRGSSGAYLHSFVHQKLFSKAVG